MNLENPNPEAPGRIPKSQEYWPRLFTIIELGSDRYRMLRRHGDVNNKIYKKKQALLLVDLSSE